MSDKVVFLCPIAESVPPKTFQSALAAVAYASANGVQIEHVGISEREMIDGARNRLTEAFLQTGVEWAFWMDADMVIPPNTITELLKVAKEKEAKLVTGIYYQRKGYNMPVIWSRGIELESGAKAADVPQAADNKYVGAFTFPAPGKKDPFPVHAAGFGCVLVHRLVFESLSNPWFEFVKDKCSEDFFFFVNAKEKGFTAWAVPSLKLGHIGDAPVITEADFYKKAFERDIQVDAIKDPNAV